MEQRPGTRITVDGKREIPLDVGVDDLDDITLSAHLFLLHGTRATHDTPVDYAYTGSRIQELEDHDLFLKRLRLAPRR